MSSPAGFGGKVRFGPFEVDLQAGELYKGGLRLHLPSQPFRILALLLERPGEIVTREQLRSELWPEGACADFDHSLNTAVNRLRAALCDSGDDQRYIDTIPKRGYRFLCSVEREEGTGAGVPPTAHEAPAARPVWLRPGTLIPVLALCLAAAGLAWWKWRVPRGPAELPGIVSLTDFPGTETTPAFSPDGAQVAFAASGGGRRYSDIYLLPMGSHTPARLTSDLADKFCPSFSPDGRRIAFYRRAGDSSRIKIIAADANNPAQLTGFGLNVGPEDPFPAASMRSPVPPLAALSWSPDASAIAYVDKAAPAEPYSVFLLNLANLNGARLTWPQPGQYGDGFPAFSPDGSAVAFVRGQTAGKQDLYVIPLAGGEPRRLTSDECAITGMGWSRDGQSIVFSSERSGEMNLWRIRAAGGPPQRLTQVAEKAVLPALPARQDGLAYVRWSEMGHLVRLPLSKDSAGPVPPLPTESPTAGASNPRFSPDGKRIAYTAGYSSKSEIWVAGSVGSAPVRITSPDRHAASPRWSPDGRFIAFDRQVIGSTGVWEVCVVPAEGGTPRVVAGGMVQNSRPSWSRDGRTIYFGSDRSGTLQIWKVPAAGGAARQVTAHGGSEAMESPDGLYLYYSRRAVEGLWRVPVDGGEEALVLKDLQWDNLRNWTLAPEGIYFLHAEGRRPSERRQTLRLYRFHTRRVEEVALLGDEPVLNAGCSLSPDGRWLLYAQVSAAETDLALLRGFR